MSKKWSKAAGRKKKRKKGYTYYYIFSLGTYWGQVALKNHSSCLNDTSVKGRRFSSETTRSLLVPIWSSWVSPIPQWAIMIQKCLELVLFCHISNLKRTKFIIWVGFNQTFPQISTFWWWNPFLCCAQLFASKNNPLLIQCHYIMDLQFSPWMENEKWKEMAC